jgi:tRNA A-37 threonylcarbamoyl transferase component Bud32
LEQAMSLPAEERTAFLQQQSEDADLLAEAEKLLSFDRQASALFSIENWQQRAERTATDANLAGTVLGHYRLLEELGRGGMGTVYLAERADGVYQQKVALKVLQENIFTPALAERFKQERQILARLQHPGIARLLDGGVMDDGRPYLVLEYVDGEPIDVYCEEQALDVDARLRLFLRVAEVVQSAHQQLVLHLDLKPANILVTPQGDPRLLDFGIARILSEGEGGSRQTEATLRLLTPRYASPEQAQGKPLGVASDVFSLATLLYRLLTGHLPYPIEDAGALEAARMITQMVPMPPSQAAEAAVAPLLRGDLDTILLQALRKEPERRYPTVAAFAEDVRRHLAHEPVLAHADSFRYRAGKFLRRNRGSVIAASLAAVILVVSAVAVVHSAIVARRERAIAERRLKDVRALAHSYIFDLDPMLAEVPGTVGVRAFILQNGLKYLEAMSKEKTDDDDDLAHEIAMGYMVISNVQSDPAMPNLNDRAGALDSMERGLAIQKRLAAKHPTDLNQLYLVVRQTRDMALLATTDGDVVRTNELLQEAWKIGEPIRATGPSAPHYVYLDGVPWDLASVNCGNGDLWNFADPMASLPWLDQVDNILETFRKARPENENVPGYVDGLQREYITRALVMDQLGQKAEAQAWYEKTLALLGRLKKTVINEQTIKVTRATYADFLVRSMHDLKKANEMAPTLLPEEYHEKGHDRQLSGDVADTLDLLARIDMASGRMAEGRKKMQIAVASFSTLYAGDPNDAPNVAMMAHDLYYLAEMHELDAATRRGLYVRSMEITEPYAKTHPQVLSAALLLARCDLGLADLAHAGKNAAEQQSRATAAMEEAGKVLAAHPVQPEASSVLARAKALAAN